MLEVAFGNVTQEQADRLGQAAGDAPDGVPHEPGGAEPWISRLVHSFVIATGARTVLETGCFKGATSAWILDALKRLGGGTFHLCEIDQSRAADTYYRLYRDEAPTDVDICFHKGDVLAYLTLTTDRFDLAWVDDCHTKPHVLKELTLLYPKMNPGGVILGHDVWGSCDLQEVFQKFGGFSLNLPRLGAAGGIGIIQLPHPESLGPWIPGESCVLA
jgi:SAM-dependent methyltransferase